MRQEKAKKTINLLKDENVEELSFPHLTPTGKFGWKHQRPIKLTPKKSFQKRILDENQTFSKDIEYLFVAQAITERKYIQDSMSIAMRQSSSQMSGGDASTAGFVKKP